MEPEKASQRIARLTPLADVLTLIDAAVAAVAPREVDAGAAVGRVLARDVPIDRIHPPRAIAWRDGFAVDAALTGDAGSYNPVPLAHPARVAAGDTLPAGSDAVAAEEHVVFRGGHVDIVAPLAPGEGARPRGFDLDGNALIPGGRRLRPPDLALLAIAGIERIPVRVPRLRIVSAHAMPDAVIDRACALVADLVAQAGGQVMNEGPQQDLAAALVRPGADAVVAIGGTGSGSRDASVSTLARVGRVAVHGIAIAPGEAAAYGLAGACPVLLLPGRIDAALAVWLTVGRVLLARLAGAGAEAAGCEKKLVRKIASPLGLAEVIPVRCRGDAAEPLASGTWPLSVLGAADGHILVPAQSEGWPAGASVVIGPWV